MVIIVNLGLLKLFIFVNKKYSEGTLEQYALAIDMLLADIGSGCRISRQMTSDITLRCIRQLGMSKKQQSITAGGIYQRSFRG